MPRDIDQTPIRVRKFEMGASGEGYDDFLKKRGWILTTCGGMGFFRIKREGAKGRPRNISRKKLLELLDSHRIAEGLEPIVKR